MADNTLTSAKVMKICDKLKHTNSQIPRTLNDNTHLLNNSIIAAQKKKTSFQITSVTVGSSRLSNDGGDDSADDLDESHTDDISRITDNETPSFSEDTLSRDEAVSTVIPTSAQYGLAILPEGNAANNHTGVNPMNAVVIEEMIGSPAKSNSPRADTPNKETMPSEAPQRSERFKVVKIESTEPFRRGRWMCMDYLDHSVNQPQNSPFFKPINEIPSLPNGFANIPQTMPVAPPQTLPITTVGGTVTAIVTTSTNNYQPARTCVVVTQHNSPVQPSQSIIGSNQASVVTSQPSPNPQTVPVVPPSVATTATAAQAPQPTSQQSTQTTVTQSSQQQKQIISTTSSALTASSSVSSQTSNTQLGPIQQPPQPQASTQNTAGQPPPAASQQSTQSQTPQTSVTSQTQQQQQPSSQYYNSVPVSVTQSTGGVQTVYPIQSNVAGTTSTTIQPQFINNVGLNVGSQTTTVVSQQSSATPTTQTVTQTQPTQTSAQLITTPSVPSSATATTQITPNQQPQVTQTNQTPQSYVAAAQQTSLPPSSTIFTPQSVQSPVTSVAVQQPPQPGQTYSGHPISQQQQPNSQPLAQPVQAQTYSGQQIQHQFMPQVYQPVSVAASQTVTGAGGTIITNMTSAGTTVAAPVASTTTNQIRWPAGTVVQPQPPPTGTTNTSNSSTSTSESLTIVPPPNTSMTYPPSNIFQVATHTHAPIIMTPPAVGPTPTLVQQQQQQQQQQSTVTAAPAATVVSLTRTPSLNNIIAQNQQQTVVTSSGVPHTVPVSAVVPGAAGVCPTALHSAASTLTQQAAQMLMVSLSPTTAVNVEPQALIAAIAANAISNGSSTGSSSGGDIQSSGTTSGTNSTVVRSDNVTTTANEDESASAASTVAIDNKIEQAMDLVKSHLMFAVREEVEVLKEKIAELMDRINQLEVENSILKASAPIEILQQLPSPGAGSVLTSSAAAVAAVVASANNSSSNNSTATSGTTVAVGPGMVQSQSTSIASTTSVSTSTPTAVNNSVQQQTITTTGNVALSTSTVVTCPNIIKSTVTTSTTT